MTGKSWSVEEIEFLKENMHLEYKLIAEKLNRSLNSVHNKIRDLGLIKRHNCKPYSNYKHSIKHPIYNCQKRMKNLCVHKTGKLYEGLPYCEEWLNYDVFYEWCINNGWEEDKVLTLKEKEKGYTPDNCYFTTKGDIVKGNINIEKSRETMNIRYGGWYTTTDEYLERKKKTCLEKYGVEHSQQTEEIKEKIKQTNIERYGGPNPMHSQEVKDKIMQTNLEKRGVCWPAQDPSVISKIKNTMVQNGNMYDYQGKCSQTLADEVGVSRSGMNAWIRKYGLDEAISMTKTVSSLEKKIHNFLDSLSIEYLSNIVINNYKPDIVIDNLIIECDGVYWHSDAINKDKYYHRNKMRTYNEHGYKSLFFRENEINEKFAIVASIIKHHLNLSQKLYGRKCEFREVDKNTAKIFFRENHLMGKGKGDSIGLYYNDELVSCLQYTNRDIINIERFCHKTSLMVVGGFTKLLNKLPKKPIQTFVDMRYGDGKYLTTFGFEKKNEDVSFKWVKNEEVLHRLKFPGNSGYEFGYNKLWDCGQSLYLKNQ